MELEGNPDALGEGKGPLETVYKCYQENGSEQGLSRKDSGQRESMATEPHQQCQVEIKLPVNNKALFVHLLSKETNRGAGGRGGGRGGHPTIAHSKGKMCCRSPFR